MTKIEHSNITVPDIDEAIAFISLVAPDFKIRKDESPLIVIAGYILETMNIIFP